MGAEGKVTSGDGLGLKQGTQPPDSQPLGLVRSQAGQVRPPLLAHLCLLMMFLLIQGDEMELLPVAKTTCW